MKMNIKDRKKRKRKLLLVGRGFNKIFSSMIGVFRFVPPKFQILFSYTQTGLPNL